jgi:chromosome partitioning protein
VTRYDSRLLVHKTYERQLRQLYGASVLHTVIPEAPAFKVSLACRQPVTCYAPHSKAALATSQLGSEITEQTRQRTREQKIA